MIGLEMPHKAPRISLATSWRREEEKTGYHLLVPQTQLKQMHRGPLREDTDRMASLCKTGTEDIQMQNHLKTRIMFMTTRLIQIIRLVRQPASLGARPARAT